MSLKDLRRAQRRHYRAVQVEKTFRMVYFGWGWSHVRSLDPGSWSERIVGANKRELQDENRNQVFAAVRKLADNPRNCSCSICTDRTDLKRRRALLIRIEWADDWDDCFCDPLA